MIDLECPSCHAPGSVPKEKSQGRLVCKKCHQVFHLSPTGRALPGEPPHAPEDHHPHGTHPQTAGLGMSTGLLVKGIGGVAALALLGWIVFTGYKITQPANVEYLADKATRAASAMGAGNYNDLQMVVKAETSPDFMAWYDSVRPLVEGIRKDSLAHAVRTTTLMMDNDPANQKGQVRFFFAPAKGASRNEEIASEAGSNVSRETLQVDTYWVLDEVGKWWIDGKLTRQNFTPPAR